MDQFIAQILAKLDTRQAEADLTSLTKDRDINLRVKLTGDANLLKTFQSDFNSLSSLQIGHIILSSLSETKVISSLL